MSSSYSTVDYLALPRPDQPFLIDDMLPAGGAMLIYGDPKIGKSFIALQLAQALAGGTPWLGFTTHQTSVLYVQLDTPRILWMHRLEELAESGEGIVPLPIYHADRESLNTWPFNILNPDHAMLLKNEVARLNPGVVIIDTLKESHQVGENDNTEGQRVVAALVEATQPAALIVIHHARKASDGRPNDVIGSVRGASYLAGRMDLVIAVSQRSIAYTGRASDNGIIRLERKDNGYWESQDETPQVTSWLDNLLERDDLSTREKAKMLADATHRDPEACRSIIRREEKRRKHLPTTVEAKALGRGSSE